MNNLIQIILDSIKKAQREEIIYECLFANSEQIKGKNEFLFFIKPEITLPSDRIKLNSILNLILSQIAKFNLSIKDVRILSAKYLKDYNITAQHYGVINQLASNPRKNLSEIAKNKFKEVYKKSVDECNVLGGLEILDKHKFLNALSLDLLWQNKTNMVKLASGTYCEEIKFDSDTIYLINGFHPRQLLHFTDKGRSIVVFTLIGDLKWSDARRNFIGDTNPFKANNGSLRRIFLDNIAELGLPEVSQGSNGVHLSAGPVEGLVELMRYNSDFRDKAKIKTYKDFSFGQSLSKNFSEKQINDILSNVNVEFEGKSISIFDLTEERDSDTAIDILKKVIK